LHGKVAWRTAALLCGALLFCVLSSADPVAQTPETAATTLVQPPNEALLQGSFRGESLGEPVPALLRDEQPALLQLRSMLSTLQVRLDMATTGVIAGRQQPDDWVFSFSPDGSYTINGLPGRIEPSQFMAFNGDLYVSPKTLTLLVPVTLNIDERTQRFTVHATGPLSLDLARQREMARTKLVGRGQSGDLPLQPFPYQPIGSPFGDVRMVAQNSAGQGGSSSVSYDALLSQELAYATAVLFVSGSSENRLQDARLQVGRESPQGGVFGLAGVTGAWIGDVQGPSVPFVGSAGQGRGFEISTFPLDQPDNFDQTTVEGDAPPGWDVELLRGQELLDFQRASASGRYRFEKVALLFGGNALRVVMYGPEGQRREDTRSFRVGGGMKQDGAIFWRVYAGQPGQRLLSGLLADRAADIYTASGEITKPAAASAEVELGITRQITANFFASRAPESYLITSPLRSTTGGGLRLSLPIVYMEGNLARQEDGGRAWSVGASGTLGPVNISAKHAQYDSWLSLEALQSSQPLASDTSVRLYTSLPVRGHAVGLSLTTERWLYEGGNSETSAQLQARFQYKDLFVGQAFDWHQYAYNADTLYGSTSQRLYYSPSVSGEYGRLRLSSTARFDTDSKHLEQIQLLGNWSINQQTTANLGLIYSGEDPNGNSNYGISLGVSRDFGPFFASAMVSRNAAGAVSLGIGLNMSFGFDSRGKLAMSSRPMAQAGSADVLVFNDKNGNGRFDPDDDEPLSDASIRINGQRGSDQTTDEKGHLFLTGLSTSQPLTLRVDSGSVIDPFLANAKGGVRFVPRQGRSFDAQLAMVETGEVSGKLLAMRDGQWVSLSGVVLELVTGDPAVPMARTQKAPNVRIFGAKRTQFDGGFLFDMVPPGKYLVRVRSGQHLQGSELEATEVPLELTAAHLMVDDLELRVQITTDEHEKKTGVLQ